MKKNTSRSLELVPFGSFFDGRKLTIIFASPLGKNSHSHGLPLLLQLPERCFLEIPHLSASRIAGSYYSSDASDAPTRPLSTIIDRPTAKKKKKKCAEFFFFFLSL